MRTSNYLNGVYFCLIATLSWGGMFPVMTHALKIIDPFTFTSLRYSIAGIFFLIFLYIREGRSSFKFNGNMFLLSILGSAGFAGLGFFVFLGQKIAGTEGALSASMMMATMPFLGLLVNWVLKGVRPPLFSLMFILMSLTGVMFVITKGDLLLILESPANYSANALMIIGALCWVIYTIGATYYPQWSPIKYTALSTLFGLPTVYLVTIVLIACGAIPLPSLSSVISITPELLYMSLIAGFLAVLCWNQGNKIITPINGVLFMDIVPITAFIVSTIEGVAPNQGQLFGIAITASALILNNLVQRRKLLLASKLSTA